MKKLTRYLTLLLLLFNALGAFYGGFFLMMDPTGKLLHMTTYRLMRSPFIDYFYPGLVLILANGVLSLTAAIAVWKGARYAVHLVLVQGLVLLGWIFIQSSMLETFNELHLTMAAIGVLLVAIAGNTLIRHQAEQSAKA